MPSSDHRPAASHPSSASGNTASHASSGAPSGATTTPAADKSRTPAIGGGNAPRTGTGAPELRPTRRRQWLICLGTALLCGLLHLLAFPPFNAAATAYIFAIPLLLLALKAPRKRTFAIATFIGFWASWTVILLWLRYIEPPWGMLAAIALAAILAAFPLVWFLFALRVMPRLDGQGFLRRTLMLCGLAGLWIVLEWVRAWLFTGFPWLPLSASQWQLPVMLQVAAWTGHYGVSFILVFFNLALVQYLRNWLVRFRENPLETKLQTRPAPAKTDARGHVGEQNRTGSGECSDTSDADETPEAEEGDRQADPQLRWKRGNSFSARPSFGLGGGSLGGPAGRIRVKVCPEFYLALIFLMGSILLYQRTLTQMRHRTPMFTAAVVQPWTKATLKWQPEQARQTLETLYDLTLAAAEDTPKPDVIVWPETALPFALLDGDERRMAEWVNTLVRQTGTPLLTGALARVDGVLSNGLFYANPHSGVGDLFYAKRRLVPFGEYRPLRALLPFIDKVVPIPADIAPGAAATPVIAEIAGQRWRIGALICYEDIFSSLGRESALADIDLLLVVTNDAWYGESSGAYQHAAHSVLRAVETRRPLLRNGNHGWSGWIDEAGAIRGNLTDATGNIYLRGTGSFELFRATTWIGRQTFYTRHGDWFVGLCGAFTLWAFAWTALPAKRQRQ